jgi:hypothetical protein
MVSILLLKDADWWVVLKNKPNNLLPTEDTSLAKKNIGLKWKDGKSYSKQIESQIKY